MIDKFKSMSAMIIKVPKTFETDLKMDLGSAIVLGAAVVGATAVLLKHGMPWNKNNEEKKTTE